MVVRCPRPSLAAHPLPALVLWGEGDRYVPVHYAPLQSQYFQAKVHVLPGCGHIPMADDPALVAEVILGNARLART